MLHQPKIKSIETVRNQGLSSNRLELKIVPTIMQDCTYRLASKPSKLFHVAQHVWWIKKHQIKIVFGKSFYFARSRCIGRLIAVVIP